MWSLSFGHVLGMVGVRDCGCIRVHALGKGRVIFRRSASTIVFFACHVFDLNGGLRLNAVGWGLFLA